MQVESNEITYLLNAWCRGEAQALDRLAPIVEGELRRLARVYLSKEDMGHTLQPTALVNEAYLRLIQWDNAAWQNRAHFYAVAAKMMRHILVNEAISRGRKKRGGSAVIVLLEAAEEGPSPSSDILALHEALLTLAKLDDRKRRLVELRFFGGLSAEETAEVLGISVRTVHREWDLARAWLFRELTAGR